MSLPPLATLRAFEAAARHQSFKNAASELGVTPTAISHQVRLLEETLAVQLFDRKPRQVVLTDVGQALYPVLRDGFASFAKAIDQVRNRPASRSVTVSVIPSFAAKWLLPRLPRFQAEYPDINLRLHTSPEAVDLAGGVADAAIRYGVGPYPGLVASPLFREHFVPLCSPSLGLEKTEDLRKTTLLHFDWLRPDDATPTWQRWGQVAGCSEYLPDAGISFSDDSHAIQAAIAGQGVVLASPAMVRAEIDAGLLVMPFGPEIKGHSYHYVHTGRGDNRREVEAFGDWIKNEVASSGSLAE
ncbi:LysR family transcriptional regulator [Thalassospira sp. HJ]|uniref:transcriptional regulator GcvA n=1 Tax=Thalassospira sp. HJ TaxID=1616823 RepID=UPI0005CE6DD4|nr:transcriptional regulator GcvA [Thalassospira sp. HJ]KJE35122.1 LysR family transcriptional regulator [Thalassospira sp. HJ]